MLGAIHILSAARNADWIDTLLAPCPRIKVWIDELKCDAREFSHSVNSLQTLSPTDRSWVLLNSQLAIEAARMISHELVRDREVNRAGVDKES